MKDWKTFWQNYRIFDIKTDNDLLYQVGASVGGNAIDKTKFRIICHDSISNLDLNENDDLLDLCCGNGVLTYEFAKVSNSVVGIDFSEPFIKNAIKYKKLSNVAYISKDVTKLNENKFANKIYTKVFMHEALAYLNENQFDKLLSDIKSFTSPDVKILICGILDVQKKWKYFNTIQRKLIYLVKFKIFGKDVGVGKWWTQKEITNIANKNGYQCNFIAQNSVLHTAHYRFDVLITKKDG